MAEWGTRYDNAADDGAPYIGRTLVAENLADALALLEWVKGPNGEALTIDGEIVERMPADVIGDTHRIIRRHDA